METDIGALSWLSLQMYGLAIVISLVVAVVIKLIVVVLSMSSRRGAAPATAKQMASPAAPGPAVDHAQDDIAAIAAAVYALVGAHRIVRIQEAVEHGRAWTAEGRILHQTSHQPRKR